MKGIFFLIFFLLLFNTNLQAQINWKYTCYNCVPGESVKTDSRDNVYVLSSTSISKISPSGASIWKANITLPGYTYINSSSLLVDDRDKVIIAGYAFNVNDSARAFVMNIDTGNGHIIKTCKDDTLIITPLYGGTANASYYSVGLYQDVNYNLNLLFGYKVSTGGMSHVFAAMQVNDNLDIQKIFKSQEATTEGYIAGYATKDGSVYYGAGTVLGKVNNSFTASSWTYTMDSSQAVSLIRGDNAGNVYVVNNWEGYWSGFTINKIADLGTSAQKLWKHSYRNGYATINDFKFINGTNSIYVGGSYNTYQNSSLDHVYYAAKIDLSSQNVVWQHYDSVSKRIFFNNMAIDADGLLAAATTVSRTGHKSDYCYIKYDGNGVPTYEYYDGACKENDGPSDITVNHANQVILTGSACENTSVSVATTLLYANGTGTGIGELTNSLLKVYPNPTEDKLTVSLVNDNVVKYLKFTSLDGKELFLVPNSSNEIDVHQLTTGVYILGIELEGGETVYRRIVKQ